MTQDTTLCPCDFQERAPLQHDMLLAIEQLSPPEAARLIADLLAETDMCVGNEERLIEEPADYARFVAQHNWTDPVGMFYLGEAAELAGEQAWRSPVLMEARQLRMRLRDARNEAVSA